MIKQEDNNSEIDAQSIEISKTEMAQTPPPAAATAESPTTTNPNAQPDTASQCKKDTTHPVHPGHWCGNALYNHFCKKTPLDELPDKEESPDLKSYYLYEIRDFFFDNIPYGVAGELPVRWRYIVGILSYMMYWALFGYFFYVTYMDETKYSPYVSTSYEGDTCSMVPVTITSSQYVDYDGLWEGEDNFAYYAAPFRFQFMKFSVPTLSKFEDMMDDYHSSISSIGNFAKTQPLAVNLVIWMSYIRYYSLDDPEMSPAELEKIGSDNLQYMEFSGDPAIVFKGPYQQAVISGYKGACNVSGLLTSYHTSDAIMRLEIGKTAVAKMALDDVCNTAASSTIFAKLWGKKDRVSRFDFDVRSFSTAMSVNMGFTPLATLGVTDDITIHTINGVDYQIGNYFDKRYNTMASITCITDATPNSPNNDATDIETKDLCLIHHGQSYFLPVFNHLGTSLDTPIPCDCDSTKDDDICDLHYLIPSLIFYKTDSNFGYGEIVDIADEQWEKLLSLRQKYTTYLELNTAAYTASATAVISYLGYSDQTFDESSFTAAHEFCYYNNSDYCSMITFASLNDADKSISPYQYKLDFGHCNDTFSILDNDAWTNAKEPPFDIFESYYECTQSVYNGIINAIGLATGNIAIAFMIILALSVPFVFLVATFMYEPKGEDEYKPEEIQKCLDNLATILLNKSVVKTESDRVVREDADSLRALGITDDSVKEKEDLLDELVEALHKELNEPEEEEKNPYVIFKNNMERHCSCCFHKRPHHHHHHEHHHEVSKHESPAPSEYKRAEQKDKNQLDAILVTRTVAKVSLSKEGEDSSENEPSDV